MRRSSPLASWSLACVLFIASATRAAPVTEKTPNIDSPVTTPVGNADFLFTHRFYAPGGKVLNSPTFRLDAGLFRGFSLGLRYASFSDVARRVNEFEPIVALEILRQRTGSPFDVTATAAYNTT